MNFYVGLMTNVVGFIENNIQQPLSLDEVASEFSFSAFHFNRIFRTVTGQTLKQYILGRKLSLAMERLGGQANSITAVAYDLGFQSPEVFSRAFKKQFGISPHLYQKTQPRIDPVRKAVIVERDIVNYQGRPALKGSLVPLDECALKGVGVQVNVNQPEFETRLRSASETFYSKACQLPQFNTDTLYALVNCLGEDDGNYQVFYGLKTVAPLDTGSYLSRTILQGWYARFLYSGDMFDVRLSFINDLYHWVMVREIELENNGIGMLNLFQSDYPQTRQVEIFVPVKSPA